VAVLKPQSVLDQPLRLAPYGYGGGDAINRADPNGEFWGAVLAGVATAVAITVTAQYANAPNNTNPQLRHKGLAELALQATATAISLFQATLAAVAVSSAGASIAQRALARVAQKTGQGAAPCPFAGLGDGSTSPALADPRVGISEHVESFKYGGSFLVPDLLLPKIVA
jgi:hypothetical protein